MLATTPRVTFLLDIFIHFRDFHFPLPRLSSTLIFEARLHQASTHTLNFLSKYYSHTFQHASRILGRRAAQKGELTRPNLEVRPW
jgi:hypothetical protein